MVAAKVTAPDHGAVAVLLAGLREESVKPKGRSRKAQPATRSMFEWSLVLEQEADLVDAGH